MFEVKEALYYNNLHTKNQVETNYASVIVLI